MIKGQPLDELNADQIIEALNSPDEEIRLQGLRALAAAPLLHLDLIFKAFADSSWRVRKDAVDLFLSMPISRELVGEIVELLHAEENAGLRNAAVEILTRMGRDALPMLLDQASCPDHDVRKFIVDILGDIADPSSLPILIRALDDEDSNVRAAAAENLGKLKAVEAVPSLLNAMKHQDVLLQFTVLDALGRIAAPVSLSQVMAYKNEKLLRKALLDCLGKAGDASAAGELVQGLTDSMRNVREAAILALAEIQTRHPQEVVRCLAVCETGPASAAVMVYLAEGSADALRRAAVRVLGWLGATDAVVPLLGLLDVESLQQEALKALIHIGSVAPRSLLAAWSAVSGSRRAYLAYVCGEAACRESIGLLRSSLHEADPGLQRMSAYALGKLGVSEVLPDLVACLENDSVEVQEAATEALGLMGKTFAEETYAAVSPLLGHADAEQRMFAVLVIRELNVPAVHEALGMALKDSDARVRRAAVKGFERFELCEHFSTLLLTLTDEDAEVRRTAVEILSASGAEDALDGLQLALKDEDLWVRSTAVRGLGQIDCARSRSLVEGALTDPVGLVSISALETLAGMSGVKACPLFVDALEHADQEVVTAALNLLTHYCVDDWLNDHAERLINHPSWSVRSHFSRIAAELLRANARPLLERRLQVETEALIRQQLTELLGSLPEA